MTLSSREMKRLEQHSALLGADRHKAYLAEAIDVLRSSGEVRLVLRLLTALWHGARGNQKEAIGDLRRWIESRLLEEPKISAERMLLELGWLRRMCVVRSAERPKRSR